MPTPKPASLETPTARIDSSYWLDDFLEDLTGIADIGFEKVKEKRLEC